VALCACVSSQGFTFQQPLNSSFFFMDLYAPSATCWCTDQYSSRIAKK
jgi:hypothetical protein